MIKRILTLMLAVSVLAYCKPAAEQQGEPSANPSEEPSKEPASADPSQDVDDAVYAKAAPEVKNGDKVLATNPNMQKFLDEVTYEDKDCTDPNSTKIYDYYGGYNGKTYDENGNEDPNGKKVKSPNSDKPCSYSIRWTPNTQLGAITVHLEDATGWKADYAAKAGSAYLDITNLVPNVKYTYKATATDGTVLAEGSFDTYGGVHQAFFANACRNGRDLGGWKTADGKTIKYRLLYRGGRMNSGETVSKSGREEIVRQNILAQLDLRGHSDVLSTPAVPGNDFCAPVIEQGGKAMLTDVYADGEKKGLNKTKECFMFCYNSVKAGKGVWFHCSLGRDRTGTLSILLMGLLGVPEHDIAKEYELTYFAPVGYSVSSSEYSDPDDYYFRNTHCAWVYSEIVPYFWSLAGSGSFADGVEKYLIDVAKVDKAVIDDFRSIMLQ